MRQTVWVLLAAMTALGCEVDQTQQGELPDVDVDVEEGALPEYDVNWADVDVGTTERTVTVPKLVVVMEEETVSVPVIDVSMPQGDDREIVERTLTVETEVPHAGYDLSIEHVYAEQNRVHVVARLTEERTDAPQQQVRVSDRLVINAPDTDVRYYIVGARPEGVHNAQYEFVETVDALPMDVRGAREIYSAPS